MRVFPVILIAVALSGCATYRPAGSGDHFTAGTAAAVPADPPARASGLPQFVIPVTGGPMLVALPLGGSFYLPLDGAAPLVGTAVAQ
jgi:hypothetical protein